MLLREAVCWCIYTSNCGFGMRCTIVPGVIVGEPSARQKCKFTPGVFVVVYKLVIVALT